VQLQTTSPESKFPNEYTDVIFIEIDQHLKKLLPKYKEVPILWNTSWLLGVAQVVSIPSSLEMQDTNSGPKIPNNANFTKKVFFSIKMEV